MAIVHTDPLGSLKEREANGERSKQRVHGPDDMQPEFHRYPAYRGDYDRVSYDPTLSHRWPLDSRVAARRGQVPDLAQEEQSANVVKTQDYQGNPEPVDESPQQAVMGGDV
jgi:hypothetical protein